MGPIVVCRKALWISCSSWLSFEFVNTPQGVTVSPELSNLGFVCHHVLPIFNRRLTCVSGNLLVVHFENLLSALNISLDEHRVSTGGRSFARGWALPLLFFSSFFCERFLSERQSSAPGSAPFACSRDVSFTCVWLPTFASMRVSSSRSSLYFVMARKMQRWFADSISLQIMLADSALASGCGRFSLSV